MTLGVAQGEPWRGALARLGRAMEFLGLGFVL